MTPASERMKARLRADLRECMKARDTGNVRLLRGLISAIDNAEARPIDVAPPAGSLPDLRDGVSEAPRRVLDAEDVRAVLLSEIADREIAAADLSKAGRDDDAARLLAEAARARSYVA